MSEPTPLHDAARIHLTDQTDAWTTALARKYAIFYGTLVAGNVPPNVAADMVQVMQRADLQVWAHGQCAT